MNNGSNPQIDLQLQSRRPCNTCAMNNDGGGRTAELMNFRRQKWFGDIRLHLGDIWPHSAIFLLVFDTIRLHFEDNWLHLGDIWPHSATFRRYCATLRRYSVKFERDFAAFWWYLVTFGWYSLILWWYLTTFRRHYSDFINRLHTSESSFFDDLRRGKQT